MTIASVMGGLLLFVFSLGVFIQAKNAALGVLLIIFACPCFAMAVISHRSVKLARIATAMMIGNSDKKKQSQEVVNV